MVGFVAIMTAKLFGNSSQGLPIICYEFGEQGPVVLILGGTHGDEPEGNWIVLGLLGKWIKDFPYRLRLTLIPCFNIEGSLSDQRTNANKVDLNRNLPTRNWTSVLSGPASSQKKPSSLSTKDDVVKAEKERYNPGPHSCSEEENKSLVRWIDDNKPRLIISLHSWKPMININGDCQPEANIMSEMTGYKLVDYIGYPTPGSLGEYCGAERNIPVITYEAARGRTIKEALNIHVPAIEKALFVSEKRI